MRSLLVTRNYPPLVGGMERVCLEVSRALASAGTSAVVGPTGAAEFSPPKTAVTTAKLRPLWRFLLEAGLRSVWTAIRTRPEVVFAGSGLTAPIAVVAAKLVSARSVVYVHGLDIVAPSWLYQNVWIPFIRRSNLVICNSENTRSLAEMAGVSSDRTRVLNPGTSVPALDSAPELIVEFRRLYGLGDGPLMLSVGRFTRRKGLVEFVERALPTILQTCPQAKLLIVGDEAMDALHGAVGGVRAEVESKARALGLQEQIRFSGRLSDEHLQAAYAAAACHVFPVLDVPGDVEGFGMVALEAAAHGLPTVAFGVGGVPDAVQPGVTGQLIEAGDYVAFAAVVAAYLASGASRVRSELAREFARGKDWQHFREGLISFLKREPAHEGS